MSGMVLDGGVNCPAAINGALEMELSHVPAQWAEDRVSASTLDLHPGSCFVSLACPVLRADQWCQ